MKSRVLFLLFAVACLVVLSHRTSHGEPLAAGFNVALALVGCVFAALVVGAALALWIYRRRQAKKLEIEPEPRRPGE